MTGLPALGGLAIERLAAGPPHDPAASHFTEAFIAPGRGMLLLQLRAHLPALGEVDLLASPPLEALDEVLTGQGEDARGNASFSLGGAILLPFANRIRGEANHDRLAVRIDGRSASLPLNWGGKRPDAERYAMHGLILDTPMPGRRTAVPRGEACEAEHDLGDFGAGWPSRARARIVWTLTASIFHLSVEVTNSASDT